MLIYLVNVSLIWLFSLLVYDLLLRKDTHHAYNRTYLVFTFLEGVLLPLWKWDSDSVLYGSRFSGPVVQQASIVKHDIVANADAISSTTSISWTQYLLYIYIVGVCIAFILLLVELMKVFSFYKRGVKHKDGKWTIIQTHKEHSPFSLFHYLFVGSKEQYTDGQWSIILHHEAQHARSLHFVDQLLFQLGKIIFWFHPFVYIYSKRLLMLHEYEADYKSAKDPHVYSTFLIEQALLQSAPTISHSFNRSPIKSRIIMLTRKSSAFAKNKLFLIMPLTLVCMTLFTNNIFSAKFIRQGNVIKHRGNTIELSGSNQDTVMVQDKATGKSHMVISRMESVPLKLNGHKIYTSDDDNIKNRYKEPITQQASLTAQGIMEYLLTNMKKEIALLDDGEYTLGIDNIVLNGHGAIVFYEYTGIRRTSNKILNYKLPKTYKSISDQFCKKIEYLLDNAPLHEPAYLNGVGVPFLIGYVDAPELANSFSVKNHKLYSL